MNNIFKALGNVKFNSDRRSHEVILAARRAARESIIDPQAAKWGVVSAPAPRSPYGWG